MIREARILTIYIKIFVCVCINGMSLLGQIDLLDPNCDQQGYGCVKYAHTYTITCTTKHRLSWHRVPIFSFK